MCGTQRVQAGVQAPAGPLRTGAAVSCSISQVLSRMSLSLSGKSGMVCRYDTKHKFSVCELDFEEVVGGDIVHIGIRATGPTSDIGPGAWPSRFHEGLRRMLRSCDYLIWLSIP